MKTSTNFGLQLPEKADDVLVDVLSNAFTKLDTGARVSAGAGVSVATNNTTKVQTIAIAPETILNTATNNVAPSSKAVADYVQGLIASTGAYRGQFTYYGTLAQIKAQTANNVSGVYLNAGVVYTISKTTGSWPTAGTVLPNQVSGDTFDIVGLLDYPATGGGFDSGSLRYVKDAVVANSTFVVTGAAKAVKSITSNSTGLTVNNTDPFNPVLGMAFGTVGSGNTTQPVTGASVNEVTESKQNKLTGTSGNAVLFGASSGQVASRAVVSVAVKDSNALITSGGAYNTKLSLENEAFVVSFASTQPTPLAGEKILWLAV